MNKYRIVKCKYCEGSGKRKVFDFRMYRYNEEQIEEMVKLHEKGLSLRAICAKVGVNHPQSVRNLIIRYYKDKGL